MYSLFESVQIMKLYIYLEPLTRPLCGESLWQPIKWSSSSCSPSSWCPAPTTESSPLSGAPPRTWQCWPTPGPGPWRPRPTARTSTRRWSPDLPRGWLPPRSQELSTIIQDKLRSEHHSDLLRMEMVDSILLWTRECVILHMYIMSGSPSASFTQGISDESRSNQRTFVQQQSKTTVNKTKKINQSRKQIIKMLLVIICVFTACWCPRFLLNIIKWIAPMKEWEFNYNSQTFYYFSRIAKMLPVVHAMLNPIIYR